MAYQDVVTEEQKGYVVTAAIIAAVIVFVLNIRALYCGFAPMDDHLYVLNNRAITSLDRNLLSWAFTATPIDFWQPLTWISLALDYRIWKLNPFGYHLTNILLHAINSALVVIIADRLPKSLMGQFRTGDRPKLLYSATILLAGILFGLHPLRVESVVWITERKDVLSGLFFLGSIIFYLEYVRRKTREFPGVPGRYYWFSLGSFLLALMVKPVCVVLPLMLLVLDWYPLERFKRGALVPVAAEKIPYLLFSCAISLLTLYFASVNHILRPYDYLTISERLVVSGNAIFEYCRLMFLPLGINPFQLITFPLPLSWYFKAAAAGVAFILIMAVRKRRWLPTVWFCFLLPLLPVLAIFQNGEQSLATRYTYLPAIAFSIAAAVTVAVAFVRLSDRGAASLRKVLITAVSAWLLFCSWTTYYLTTVWDNGETYWLRIVAMQPIGKHFFALAELYEKKGDFAAAIQNYTKALEKATGDHRRYIYNIYAFRGAAYHSLGRDAEAVRDLSTAISMSPHSAYYYARGRALKAIGENLSAAEDIRIAGDKAGEIVYWYNDPTVDDIKRALELNPDDAEALNRRARMYLRSGDPDRALADLDRSIALQPGRYDYYWDRSSVFMKTGLYGRALDDCTKVVQLRPDYVDGYLRRAFILAQRENFASALQDLHQAILLDPDNPEATANRGLIMFRQGFRNDAIKDFTASLALDPKQATVYYNRGVAYAADKMPVEAEADLRQAQRLGYSLSDEELRRIISGKR